mmetsp:Transcript_148045/g.473921  ORF Transcript_148045/g.473921 Transcript_148045/m.473921 type:complete len:224 (-) Transcript_148045:31-702(-)
MMTTRRTMRMTRRRKLTRRTKRMMASIRTIRVTRRRTRRRNPRRTTRMMTTRRTIRMTRRRTRRMRPTRRMMSTRSPRRKTATRRTAMATSPLTSPPATTSQRSPQAAPRRRGWAPPPAARTCRSCRRSSCWPRWHCPQASPSPTRSPGDAALRTMWRFLSWLWTPWLEAVVDSIESWLCQVGPCLPEQYAPHGFPPAYLHCCSREVCSIASPPSTAPRSCTP